MPSKQHEVQIRCYCHHEPLLAVAGRTPDGMAYVHIRAWRGRKLITESVYTAQRGGSVRIKCRECYRWTTINVVGGEIPAHTTGDDLEPDLARVLEEANPTG